MCEALCSFPSNSQSPTEVNICVIEGGSPWTPALTTVFFMNPKKRAVWLFGILILYLVPKAFADSHGNWTLALTWPLIFLLIFSSLLVRWLLATFSLTLANVKSTSPSLEVRVFGCLLIHCQLNIYISSGFFSSDFINLIMVYSSCGFVHVPSAWGMLNVLNLYLWLVE